MLKEYFIKSVFVFFISLPLISYCQNPIDTTNTDTVNVKNSSWLFETGYGSNSAFLGRTPVYRLPYLLGSIGYINKTGLYLSFSSFGILDTAGTQNFMNITGGYNFQLSERIDGSVSYSRFFVDPSSLMLQTTTTNLADAFLGWDWSYLYTSVGLMSTFGTVRDYFFIFSNSRYFNLKSKLIKKGSLGIEPCLMVISGTQNFASSYTENYQQNFAPINQGPAIPNSPKPGGGKPNTSGNLATTNNSGFNILSFDLNVPLTYSINNFSVEGSWKYIIPVNLLEGDPSKAQSIWYLSMYYNIKTKKS
jgi:hypothetical protein